MSISSTIAAIKKTETFTQSLTFNVPEKFSKVTQTADINITLAGSGHLDNSFYTISITPDGTHALAVDTTAFYVEGVLDPTQHNILYFHYFNSVIRPKCTVQNIPKFLPLTAPANLVATMNSSTLLTITWNASTNATQYVLQRSSTTDFASAITLYTGPATSFVNSGLTSATTYYYRVMAQAFGYTDSSFSLTATGTTQ